MRMKRLVLILLTLSLLSVCIFAACADEDNKDVSFSVPSQAKDEDEPAQSESSSAAPESSEATSSEITSSEASSEPDEPTENDGSVKLLFTRYTQKPTFVMIGTCALGAKVTATIGDESLTVDSYMGWFEMSFTKSGSSHRVTFTQTVDGAQIGEAKTFFAKPSTPPSNWTYAFGSNEAFQFFLGTMVDDFVGGNTYSAGTLNKLTDRVKSRVEQVREYNEDAEIIYVIAPSPLTTYPELAPDNLTKGTGETRYDQVAKALKLAGATVIDLRNEFVLHKDDEMPLYYKLDSHWADYGAYIAYKELFEHISQKFPEAEPRSVDEFKWTADYYISADACLYLGIEQKKVQEYAYYREFDFEDVGNITSVPRYRGMQLIYNDLTTEEKIFKTERSELPSCVVYRDSYCAGIYDILAERMDTTHYIGMWNYAWQKDLIQKEKPDYVIYIVAEWNIGELVNN